MSVEKLRKKIQVCVLAKSADDGVKYFWRKHKTKERDKKKVTKRNVDEKKIV